MITNTNVEKAADYIREYSDKFAKAKSERVFLQEFRKSKKALLINEAAEGTGQSKESYAYAHDDYIQVLEGLREAIREEEKLKWMLVAAQIKVEIWKSEQYSNRVIDKTHQ